MKKILLALLAAASVFAMVSCKSANQEAVNSSFNKVYSAYVDAVILDGADSYVVQKGDTLTAITKKFYGDANGYYFPLIMLASHEKVADPEFIEPGMKLTIPQFEENINNKSISAKLSPYFKDIADVYKQKKSKAAKDIRQNLLAISDELAK